MLSGIAGELLGIHDHLAEISPGGGMTFEVNLPAYLARSLGSQIGRRVELTTKTILEGQSAGSSFTPRLLGFADKPERAFFEKFTTVRGVGVRKAMRALVEPPPAIIGAIESRDAQRLQRLPEIGKRLAETIIAELHGKLTDLGFGFVTTPGGGGAVEPMTSSGFGESAADALAALVALGETRAEAERRIVLASAKAPDANAQTLIALALGGV